MKAFLTNHSELLVVGFAISGFFAFTLLYLASLMVVRP
jgi:hypothetical protein